MPNMWAGDYMIACIAYATSCKLMIYSKRYTETYEFGASFDYTIA